MIGSIASKEGTHLQGFIEIEKVNTKDNVRELYKNTITNGGKQYFLDKSAAAMMGMSADIFGNVACSNLIGKTGADMQYPPAAKQGRSDRDITNVLLNLPDEVLASMGASTSFVNVWNNEMSEADKVVGYANNNIIATADGKEGVIDHCKGDYMVDPFTICKRWKYAEGIATGSFNCIAMMPASVIKENTGDGIKFSRCIDKVNTQYQNYASMSTGFLIPGIPGYTANNEILLNFSKDGINKWKYNLGTGEITQVPDTDNFFIPTTTDGEIVDMQYIDNYLYVLSFYIANSGNTNIQVKVYDPANAMANVASFECRYLQRYEYKIKASIFKVGSDLYVSALGSTQSMQYTGCGKLWKLTIGSNGYATGAGTGLSDFSSIGLTIPASMNISTVGLGAYGSNYVLYYTVKLYNNVSASKSLIGHSETGYKMVGYVFTDLSNPIGSIVDMIPGICPNEVLFTNNALSGTIRIGFDKHNPTTERFGGSYDLVHAKHIVMNNSSTNNIGDITANTMQAGVYVTLDKWWTNIISFVKLNTPIQKTENDIVYVSYGYKIV